MLQRKKIRQPPRPMGERCPPERGTQLRQPCPTSMPSIQLTATGKSYAVRARRRPPSFSASLTTISAMNANPKPAAYPCWPYAVPRRAYSGAPTFDWPPPLTYHIAQHPYMPIPAIASEISILVSSLRHSAPLKHFSILHAWSTLLSRPLDLEGTIAWQCPPDNGLPLY